MTTVGQSPTAAGSGASATQSFRTTEKYQGARGEAASPERVSKVVEAVLASLHQVIRDYEVTYPEYQAAKGWLIEVGEGGEWPLFLDVFVEHAVEEVQAATQQGTKGTILGPYYLPGAARLPARATLPMRPDEKGSPLVFSGQIHDVDGGPISGAEIDIWQADDDGFYSGFARICPRATCVVWSSPGTMAASEIRTILPAPYQIPTDGPTGEADRRCGMAPVAPCASAPDRRCPGHRAITTQLYFRGGEGDSTATSPRR